jgi:hypothetical protein
MYPRETETDAHTNTYKQVLKETSFNISQKAETTQTCNKQNPEDPHGVPLSNEKTQSRDTCKKMYKHQKYAE